MNLTLRQTILERATLAQTGFMTQCAESVATGLRVPFCYEMLPIPSISPSQWDHGDNTSRALRAWHCLRDMDIITDVSPIEAGLWQHFRAILHPETGLAFVPEHSNNNQGPFYYHSWDQGRVFDYLVLRWSEIATSPQEKDELLARIRRLQQSLINISATAQLPDSSLARWWPAEVYYDTQPQPQTGNVGPHDFRGWCIGVSQFLPPQVRFAALTRDPDDIKLALEMAHGFLAGYENRRGSTSPMFDDTGKFYGHFHGAVSGLDGILQLACLLYQLGDKTTATQWIELAARVYRWINDQSHNHNPGSTCGCFSETASDSPHGTSELCCTADMIEFAIHLAQCADLQPNWAPFADLWDNVESYIRNEVFKTQLTNADNIADLLTPNDTLSPQQAKELLQRQQGIWIFGRPFLHDLIRYQKPETIHTAAWLENNSAAPASSPLVPVLRSGGCCAYSGVRALHTVWHHAAQAAPNNPAHIEMRIPIDYQTSAATITQLPHNRGLSIQTRQATQIRLRVPNYITPDSLQLSPNPAQRSWSPDKRWLTMQIPPHQQVDINWQLQDSQVTETFGPLNENSVVPNIPTNQRVTCTLHYHGPEVTDVTPSSATRPYPHGL